MTKSTRTVATGAASGFREPIAATRATFLFAGLALASWAPLVPLAKARLGIDDGLLGLLLLCLGLGSICAMPIAGSIASRAGCRAVILCATVILFLTIPALVLASSTWALGLSLAVFGASVGSIDVTMNIQAAILEQETGRPMMSGFHGMFTLGSIAGAGGMSLMLGVGLPPLTGTFVISAVVAYLCGFAAPNLLARGGGSAEAPWFVLPRGRIIAIGALCFTVFLAEGVVLDWSGLFLIDTHGFEVNQAGAGYTAFAVAMTIGRFGGDWIVRRLGARLAMVAGSMLAAGGFLLAALAPVGGLALLGLAAVGLGAANIVPVLFSAAGRQTDMPAALALSSVTTLGYAGILIGPAAIGALANAFDLRFAILLVAATLVVVAICGPLAIRGLRQD